MIFFFRLIWVVFPLIEVPRKLSENGRSWQLADAFLYSSHPEQKGRESTLTRPGHVLF